MSVDFEGLNRAVDEDAAIRSILEGTANQTGDFNVEPRGLAGRGIETLAGALILV